MHIAMKGLKGYEMSMLNTSSPFLPNIKTSSFVTTSSKIKFFTEGKLIRPSKFILKEPDILQNSGFLVRKYAILCLLDG